MRVRVRVDDSGGSRKSVRGWHFILGCWDHGEKTAFDAYSRQHNWYFHAFVQEIWENKVSKGVEVAGNAYWWIRHWSMVMRVRVRVDDDVKAPSNRNNGIGLRKKFTEMPFRMLIFALLSFRYFAFRSYMFGCHFFRNCLNSLKFIFAIMIFAHFFSLKKPFAIIFFAQWTPYPEKMAPVLWQIVENECTHDRGIAYIWLQAAGIRNFL